MDCPICKSPDSTEHIFREMMFGTRQEFVYRECTACGVLAIRDIPENLSDHYPKDYYSFAQAIDPKEAFWYRIYFKFPQLGYAIRRIIKNPYFADGKFQAVVNAKVKPGAKILDVGCGAGHLVDVLRDVGFDAHGIDAYATAETDYIHKATLRDVGNDWDLIMFHHSMEHMSDNLEALRAARDKLAANGVCLVRIPIAAWAWKHYGPDWVQLDAPRHLLIHSPKSFRIAAESAGFRDIRVTFDSTVFQFIGSELYKQNRSLSEIGVETQRMPKATLESYTRRAVELNKQEMGDQASFYLKV